MSASENEPIAVIGIGCRFPGGVRTAADLWRLAVEGGQPVGPVPVDRWDAARLARAHDPELVQVAGVGCFLDQDVWAWDPGAFSVAPAEREWVDPQSRVMLEIAWEAVEHAGIPMDRVRGSRTGVYVGTYAPDNLFREARPVTDAPNPPYLFGNFAASTAGRVAFAMDLRGPVMVVSTHCSSGLVAVDTACGALSLGECDMAVAGAVLLMLAPQTQYMEAPLLLSRRGACHAFDARADGYVRGEGAGAVLLKRLSDARRDGDRILSVIRGSAVNNDGQATRLTAPSTQMQQLLFRDAVDRAGIDPGEVGLVEAHGPGTLVGDPIEYTSINAVYGRGRGRCALGSIKTNIGHSEPVSGIAGMIKTVECLRRGVIPPNQNFQEWNPGIQRDEQSRLFIPTELTRWPVPGTVRLASVCSYGVSGTNAHVVLEAPPEHARLRRPRAARSAAEKTRLFLLSGQSPASLSDAATRLADWVESPQEGAGLGDVAHTLAVRRHHAEHRLGIVAGDAAALVERARGFTVGDAPDGVVSGVSVLPPEHAGPVFVFTGQGSQYPGMCRGLLADEPVFAETIDELEPLIAAESGFSLREMILRPDGLVGVDRIQPTLFGVGVALAALWRSWGVQPAAVIGQSLGEVAAAVVAGALTAADGAKVICRRANLLVRIAHGAMASVMLSAKDTWSAIEAAGADGVALGVLTGPRITVISGDAGQVRALVDAWNQAGVVARMVDVDVASHSPQVDPIIPELRATLADLHPGRPQRATFYSTVSHDPREPGPLDASYWVHNQRDTVRFQDAVIAALRDGHRLFLECTPHPLASRPILDTAAEIGVHNVVAAGSLRRGIVDSEAFLTNLATVHAAGFDGIDLASRYGQGDLVDLPTTAWQRTRHRQLDTPYHLVAPHLPAATQHPLLGGHVRDPETPDRHLWQTPISPRRLPWLADHQVAGVPVLPGTGFAEMLLAAAAEAFGTDWVALDGLSVDSPLVLHPEPVVTTRLTVDGDTAGAEVISQHPDGIVVHAHATARPLADHEAPARTQGAAVPTNEWTDVVVTDFHQHLRDRHDVQHGPCFTAIDRIQVHPGRDRSVARLRIADSARVSAATLRLHPALADEVVQTVVATWLRYCPTSPGPVVVAGFDEIRLYGPTGHARVASVTLDEADDMAAAASGQLTTLDGQVVAEFRGLRLRNITPPAQRFASRLSHVDWVAAPAHLETRPATDGHWVVLAPQDARWPAELASELRKRAAGCLQLPVTGRARLAETTPPSCTGVVLAVDGRHAHADPAGAALEDVAHAVEVIRELADLPMPPRLWIVFRTPAPVGFALRGLLRTAAFEHPALWPSSIESTVDTPVELVVDALLDGGQAITEISFHGAERRISRIRAGGGDDTPVPAAPAPPIRRGAAYLVTGGLGGLGLLTVRWLAERGAGRVVINGRSAPSAETQAVLDQLSTDGTEITIVTGDIAEPTVARRAIDATRAGGRELRGVLHAAGVVEDATLNTLTPTLLERVWRGKAEGAWALHRSTVDVELDFFVVYSSVASLIGSPGQAAYSAANGFLDGLVHWRHNLGLPAAGIHWGAWSEVGRGQHLAERGFLTITPADGIDALERILAAGYRQVAYSPLDLDQWIDPYPALRESTLFAGSLTGDLTHLGATTVRDDVLAAGDEPTRRHILETFIIDSVRDLLGGTSRHIGPHTSMVLLGLDSLGAVQLQQRIHRNLRVDIKPGVIWVKPSPASLADWLLAQLGVADAAHAPAQQ